MIDNSKIDSGSTKVEAADLDRFADITTDRNASIAAGAPPAGMDAGMRAIYEPN